MKNKNKIITLALALGTAFAPIATAISCGSNQHQGDDETVKVQKRNIDNIEYQVISKASQDINSISDNLSLGDNNVEIENKTRKVTGRPFSLHGHSDQVLNWSETMYPDSKFSTPINKVISHKFNGELYKSTQSTNKAHLTLLDGLNDSTSNTPIANLSADENKGYSFDYWQYLDTIVAWGGAMSEGTWQIPSADWINAAHKNGTRILGTIFFPPAAFGGNVEEVEKIFTKVGDRYPYADNLVKMANYYGFDGWFWNFETEMTGVGFDKLAGFSQYLGKISREHNVIHQLYGSVPSYTIIDDANWPYIGTPDNKLNYNEYLADYRIETSTDSKNFLKQHNIDEHAFSLGLNFEGKGFEQNNQLVKLYQENDPTYWGPNRNSMWIYTFKKNGDNSESSRERFWSSSSATRDVRYNYLEDLKVGAGTTFGDFNSMSNMFVESSTIDGRHNFSTSFNRGVGHFLFENGKKVEGIDQDRGYTNLSTQDVMPTYRWMIDSFNSDNKRVNGGTFTDVETSIRGTIKDVTQQDGAFNGSNYLSYIGNILANGKMTNKLFASKTNLKANDKFSVTYQGLKPSIQVWLEDGSSVQLDMQSKDDINSWKQAEVTIPQTLDGKRMLSWGLNFQNPNNSPYDASQIKIGKLDLNVGEAIGDKPTIGNITMQKAYSPSFQRGSNYRLQIDNLINRDKIKYIKYDVVNGDKSTLKGISGAQGVYLENIDPEYITVISGVNFCKLKATIYGNNNEVLNTQNFLIEA